MWVAPIEFSRLNRAIVPWLHKGKKEQKRYILYPTDFYFLKENNFVNK